MYLILLQTELNDNGQIILRNKLQILSKERT